jgi:hypothetical protein
MVTFLLQRIRQGFVDTCLILRQAQDDKAFLGGHFSFLRVY